jgi:hypothetical protein
MSALPKVPPFSVPNMQKSFSLCRRMKHIGGRIEDLAKAPHDPTHWAVLHSVIGDGSVPAALRCRFIEVLQRLSVLTS